MDFKQFIEYLKSQDQQGAYLFSGAEEYLKDYALSELLNKYMPGGMGDINYQSFDEEAELAQIQAAAATPPFMGAKKIMVYKNPAVLCAMGDNMKSEALQKAAQQHIAMIECLPPECILVYFVRGSVPAAHPLLRYMKDGGRAVLFPEPDKRDMPGYVGWIAKQKGLELSLNAASFLYQFSGGDLLNLSNELDKLVGMTGAIDNKRIALVCTPSSNYTVFHMLKELTAGNFAGALSVYRSLIDSGDSPAAIIAMIARQFRALAYYSDIESSEAGKDYKKLEKILGAKDFVIKNMMRLGRNMGDEQKKNIIAWCADADYEIKKGNITDEAAAEGLIMKLLSSARQS